jgi:hypothetical protein
VIIEDLVEIDEVLEPGRGRCRCRCRR